MKCEFAIEDFLAMSVSFAAAARDQQGELWRFLSGVFGFTDVPPGLDSRAMTWKYFDPHTWWPNGRSYLLTVPEGIAAHGGVAPVRFDNNGKTVDSLQVVDWAAGRLIPAAGLLMYRKCLETGGGTLLAIGGTRDARQIISQSRWFTRKDDIRYYGRPFRAWRHLAHSDKGLRSFGRFARNLRLQWAARLPRAGSWHCRPVQPGEGVFSHHGNFVPILRTRAWFDYLLRCPVLKTELVILERAGKPCGHAFLADAETSVRVVDFVVADEIPQTERPAAFSALERYVAAMPGAAEIATSSSLPEVCEVFEACGLRPRGTAPVYLADPKKLLAAGARLETNPLIGDWFYVYDPAYPFVC